MVRAKLDQQLVQSRETSWQLIGSVRKTSLGAQTNWVLFGIPARTAMCHKTYQRKQPEGHNSEDAHNIPQSSFSIRRNGFRRTNFSVQKSSRNLWKLLFRAVQNTVLPNPNPQSPLANERKSQRKLSLLLPTNTLKLAGAQ